MLIAKTAAPCFCGLYPFAPALCAWLQVATAAAMDKHPICFRFPRGNGVGVDLAAAGITGFKGVPMEVRLVSVCGRLDMLGNCHVRGGQCTRPRAAARLLGGLSPHCMPMARLC